MNAGNPSSSVRFLRSAKCKCSLGHQSVRQRRSYASIDPAVPLRASFISHKVAIKSKQTRNRKQRSVAAKRQNVYASIFLNFGLQYPYRFTEQWEIWHTRLHLRCSFPCQISSWYVHRVTPAGHKLQIWPNLEYLGAPIPTPFTDKWEIFMRGWICDVIFHNKFHLNRCIFTWQFHFSFSHYVRPTNCCLHYHICRKH